MALAVGSLGTIVRRSPTANRTTERRRAQAREADPNQGKRTAKQVVEPARRRRRVRRRCGVVVQNAYKGLLLQARNGARAQQWRKIEKALLVQAGMEARGG